MSEQFERTVSFEPGHNRIAEGFGISDMYIRFILKGPKGATQFVFRTGWYPPSVDKSAWSPDQHSILGRMEGVDVGYHSYVPLYEGQTAMEGDCPVLNAPCYYDGSGLAADRWIPIFLERGDTAVWEMLEERYHTEFDGLTSGMEPGLSTTKASE